MAHRSLMSHVLQLKRHAPLTGRCRHYSTAESPALSLHVSSLLKTAYMSFLKRTHPDTLVRYAGSSMACLQNERLIQWANDLMEYNRHCERQPEDRSMVQEILAKSAPFMSYEFYLQSTEDEQGELQKKSLLLNLEHHDGPGATTARRLLCNVFAQVFATAALDTPAINRYLEAANNRPLTSDNTEPATELPLEQPPATKAYEALLAKDLSFFDLHAPAHQQREDEFFSSLQRNIPLLEFYQDVKRYVVFPLSDSAERLASLSALYSAKRKIRYMKWKFPLLKIIFYGDHYACHPFSVLQLPSGLDAKDLRFYLEHAEGMFMRRQDSYIDPFSLPIYIDKDK